jgi:Putative  PD-(D/E)XK family member, (DUF4420)
LVDLAAAFGTLEPPIGAVSDLRFSAMPIEEFPNHRIGADRRGLPCLLIATATGDQATGPPLVLEHVSLQQGVDCRITEPGGMTEVRRLTLIRCTDSDQTLRDYFLKVCGTIVGVLGNKPTGVDVRRTLQQLVELFRALEKPPRKSVLGFWGELFVMSRAMDVLTTARAWHLLPEERFDFSLGCQRLEVKTASGRRREHHFAFEQLVPVSATQIIIASLLIERSSAGPSVSDLLTSIRSAARYDAELLLHIDEVVATALGAAWRRAMDERFDDRLAASTLAFFDSETVPKPATALPPEVSEVRFKSDLSRCAETPQEALRQEAGLFAAVLPRN